MISVNTDYAIEENSADEPVLLLILLQYDTKEKSAGEPKHFDDRPSTPDSATDKSADELTPLP